MRKRVSLLTFIPKWLLFALILVTIGSVGYLDYVTGDYSLLIFYFIPVSISGWYFGDPGAIMASILSGSARFISDYYTYQNKSIGFWNSTEDVLILLVAGLVTSNIKRIMNEDKHEKGDADGKP